MKPLAITMGDSSGIGPEIVVKTLIASEAMSSYPALVIGPAWVLERELLLRAPEFRMRRIANCAAHRPERGVIDVIDVGSLPRDFQAGVVDARTGLAAYQAVRYAVACALAGEIAAMCTAPIHPAAIAAAGLPFPGHSEMLAEQSASPEVATMLISSNLRTMVVTGNCSLRQAIEQLTVELELKAIRLACRAMRQLGTLKPRIAVAALNPSDRDGGLCGNEDAAVIAPAVAQARLEGIDVRGPIPSDTVFLQARRGQFDVVVAQYRDQARTPIKFFGIKDSVKVTAGIPFLRTGPDHGAAFEIAGVGIADASGLQTALISAHVLARAHHNRMSRLN